MDLNTLKAEWKDLLTKGFDQVFDTLDKQLVASSRERDDYVQLRSRYNGLQRSVGLGTIGFQEAEVTRAQIRAGIIGLMDRIEEDDIAAKTPGQPSLKESIFQMENRLEELNRQIYELTGIKASSGAPSLLSDIISQNVNIEEALGLVHLVNCNRDDTKDHFWEAFDAKMEKELPYQFYFLVGCPSQMPHSFSERMVYEIISSELDDNDSAIHRIIDSDDGRVKIENLPIGRNLVKSQHEFKKYFSKRFSFHKEVSFEEYIETGLPHLEYDYVSVVFETSEIKWKKHFAEYLDWIVSTFNNPHPDVPTFIFFFVIYVDTIHGKEWSPKQRDIMTKLKQITDQYDRASIFEPLDPVNSRYLQEWFMDIGEKSPSNYATVLDAFVQSFRDETGTKISQYRKHRLLDMDDIQRLQRIVYEVANGTYKK